MTDARRVLAQRQAALLAALVGHGSAPTGVDADRLDAQRRVLLAKRQRVVRRLLPRAVVDDPSFAARFERWAAAHPRRTGTSVRDDAAAFLRWW